MAQAISQVYPFIVDQYTFDRMKNIRDDVNHSSYQEFLTFNIQCINELTDDDKTWIIGLCKKLKSNMICLVDTEHCQEFEGDTFYFNNQKKLCIANPR
jgi:hypothetical protein